MKARSGRATGFLGGVVMLAAATGCVGGSGAPGTFTPDVPPPTPISSPSTPTSAPAGTQPSPSSSSAVSTSGTGTPMSSSVPSSSAVSSSAVQSPATGSATGSAASTTASTPASTVGTDHEVTFSVGGLTVHGSLRIPPNASGSVPAALLLAGSGPTDRNGNSALENFKVNTLADIADVLASDGIASLRYDKVGTGATGLGPFAENLSALTFLTYTDEAATGLTFLSGQPGIDKGKLMIVGHSEGALIGLAITVHPGRTQPPVIGLALLEPAGSRYLDLIAGQLTLSFPALVTSKTITAAQADAAAKALPGVIASIRKDGTVPAGTPALLTQAGLSPVNGKFLQTADERDPAALAKNVAASGKVRLLVTCSTKDPQVSCAQANLITTAAAGKNLTAVTLTDAIHTLNSVPASTPAAGSSLPFSQQLPGILTTWLKTVVR